MICYTKVVLMSPIPSLMGFVTSKVVLIKTDRNPRVKTDRNPRVSDRNPRPSDRNISIFKT